MKQVFQADDGTIFENEIACERYEDKQNNLDSLRELVLRNYTHNTTEADRFNIFKTWLDMTYYFISMKPTVLRNFILDLTKGD
jgi:hypothetical protein